MDVSAAVDLKRIGIIDTVKITIGLELGAHAVNLPSLHISLKILAEHLQPADQLIADIDIGDLQHPSLIPIPRIKSPEPFAPTQSAPLLLQPHSFPGTFEP